MSVSGLFSGFGAAASMFGTGLSARGASQEVAAQNRAADWNAALEDRNAAYSRLMGQDAAARSEKEAGDLRRSLDVLKGKQRAGYAAAGVRVDAGSPADVLADTAKWGEYDAQTILYNGLVEKAGHDQNAANGAMSAQMLRNTKRSAGAAYAGVMLNGISSLSKYGNW